MGTHYQQLQLQDRDEIARRHAQGEPFRAIARAVGCHHSTVLRELRRNQTPATGYRLLAAHDQAQARKRRAGHRARLKTLALRTYVEEKMTCGWSPEQIAGRWAHEAGTPRISPEAIYQYLYTTARWLIAYLPRRHPYRWSRGTVARRRSRLLHRVPLTARPPHIATRQTVGHWEADTMVGPTASSAVLQVITERRSRYVHLTKLDHKSAAQMRQALCRRLGAYPPALRQTITYDNGSENAEHYRTNQALGTASYFCQPYHSWEKGTVENTIGLIRRMVPKGRDLDPLQHRFVRYVEWLLNTRPRKCLQYRTPEEVFLAEGGALAG